MHRHVQPAALGQHVAEDEVLERLVFGGARHAALPVTRVDRLDAVARRIVEYERAEIGDLELHGDRAAAPVILEHAGDERQVPGQIRGGGDVESRLLTESLHAASSDSA